MDGEQRQMDAKALKTRSRTGCFTCRIRRVKCDETRPCCHRCQSTGRICEGFSFAGGVPRTTSAANHIVQFIQHSPNVTRPVRVSIVSEHASTEEYQAIEFFHIQTATCFGATIGIHLRQAMDHDPTVRLAAMAVGSLHRAYLSGSNDNQGMLQTLAGQYALRQYSAAINRLLRPSMPNCRTPSDVVLVSCLLFFCFECLQGHFNAAIKHITSGLKILQHEQSHPECQEQATYLPRQMTQTIFAALENQVLEIDGGDSFPVDLQPNILIQRDWSAQPNTIEGVQQGFELLYNRFLKILAVAEHLFENQPDQDNIENQLRVQHSTLQAEFSAWSVALYRFLESPLASDGAQNENEQEREKKKALPKEEKEIIKKMKLWRLVLDLFIQVEWSSSQMYWDSRTGDFLAILTQVENILEPAITISLPPLNHHTMKEEEGKTTPSPYATRYPAIIPTPPKPQPPIFCVPPGIIPPLWICATRSRHSVIRHRAIELMALCNRREGIWDSRISARVAARIVEIEENAAGIPKGASYSPLEVPEFARVQAISNIYCEGRAAKVKYIREGIGGANGEVLEESISW